MPEILILLVPYVIFCAVVGVWLRKQDHDALDETAAHAVALDDEPWFNEGRRRWR